MYSVIRWVVVSATVTDDSVSLTGSKNLNDVPLVENALSTSPLFHIWYNIWISQNPAHFQIKEMVNSYVQRATLVDSEDTGARFVKEQQEADLLVQNHRNDLFP